MEQEPELSIERGGAPDRPQGRDQQGHLARLVQAGRGRLRSPAGCHDDRCGGAEGVAPGGQRTQAGQPDPSYGLLVLRAEARPATSLVIAFIDEHRDRFGVEPTCRLLPQHGLHVASSMPTELPLDALEMAIWTRDRRATTLPASSTIRTPGRSISRCATPAGPIRRGCRLHRHRRRQPRQRHSRVGDRALQARMRLPRRAVPHRQRTRARHAQLGRLVEPRPAPRRAPPRSPGRLRGRLLNVGSTPSSPLLGEPSLH